MILQLGWDLGEIRIGEPIIIPAVVGVDGAILGEDQPVVPIREATIEEWRSFWLARGSKMERLEGTYSGRFYEVSTD